MIVIISYICPFAVRKLRVILVFLLRILSLMGFCFCFICVLCMFEKSFHFLFLKSFHFQLLCASPFFISVGNTASILKIKSDNLILFEFNLLVTNVLTYDICEHESVFSIFYIIFFFIF